MRHRQSGEVMLAIMVVMMAIVWLGSGHMGMTGHGAARGEASPGTVPGAKPAPGEF